MRAGYGARALLLVTRDPGAEALFAGALSRGGSARRVVMARNGREAVLRLARWRDTATLPSLALIDMELPGRGGLAALARLRRQPLGAALPIVVLSCSEDRADLRAAYELGANSFVLKPSDGEALARSADAIAQYWCALNVQLPAPIH